MTCRNDPGGTHHAGCTCHEEERNAELKRLLRIERIAGRVLHEIAGAQCHCAACGAACGDRLSEKAAEACAELWPPKVKP